MTSSFYDVVCQDDLDSCRRCGADVMTTTMVCPRCGKVYPGYYYPCSSGTTMTPPEEGAGGSKLGGWET